MSSFPLLFFNNKTAKETWLSITVVEFAHFHLFKQENAVTSLLLLPHETWVANVIIPL